MSSAVAIFNHMVHNGYVIFFLDMGYAYGHLLAEEIRECYYALLYSLIGNDLEDKTLIEVLGLALDWQWRDYLVSTSLVQNTLIEHTPYLCNIPVNRVTRSIQNGTTGTRVWS